MMAMAKITHLQCVSGAPALQPASGQGRRLLAGTTAYQPAAAAEGERQPAQTDCGPQANSSTAKVIFQSRLYHTFSARTPRAERRR